KSEREMSVCEMAKGLEDGNQDLDQARATLANTLAAATHYLATGEQLLAAKTPKPKVRLTAGGLYCKLAMPLFGNAAIADSDSTAPAAAKGALKTQTASAKTPDSLVVATQTAAAQRNAKMAESLQVAKGAATSAARTNQPPRSAASTGRAPVPPNGGIANRGFRAPPPPGGARGPQFGSAKPRGGVFHAPPGSPLAQRSPSLGPQQGAGPATSAGAAMRQLPGTMTQLPGSSVIGRGRTFEAPPGAPSPFTSPSYLLSSAAQIEVMKARVHDSEIAMSRYETEIQKKFALAAACVVFVLLGAPIGIRFPRGGVGLVIGVSIAVFALYYVGLIVGEDLADKLILDPVIAMWMANALFTVVGIFGLIRVQRVGGSARGGDAGELFDSIRAWIAQRVRRIGMRADRRRRVTA
ncbi:MAG TPA: LptF/LptG family permease, partial [Gemmatimonadaceae bacterium]|nr:LptF/LptG family permease [Gemmatimonadaceae bacterium]